MINLRSIGAPLLSAQSHLILIETAAKHLAEDFHSFTQDARKCTILLNTLK